jgi:hypothetical protein
MPTPYLRASQQWGTRVRVAPYSMLRPPVPSTEVVEVAEAEVVEVAAGTEMPVSGGTHETDVVGYGAVGLVGRWLIRFWFRLVISRR